MKQLPVRFFKWKFLFFVFADEKGFRSTFDVMVHKAAKYAA